MALLGGCAPTPTLTPKLRRIGYLSHAISAIIQADTVPFRVVLRDLGFVEGRDIVIELRTAENDNDRLPGLVSELLALPVDVLVTQSSPSALVAKQATSTVPIVFHRVNDPVAQGLVASIARPGGNVTGVALLPIVGAKQLELLQATIPGLRRIATIYNATGSGAVIQAVEFEKAARTLGLELQVFGVHNVDELDVALDSIARSRPDALHVGSFNLYRDIRQLPDFAAKMRLPAMYGTDQAFVQNGGLMALGSNRTVAAQRVAELVAKILKGASPADLPVEEPTDFDFIINPAAAQRIGLTIPDSVVRRATDVIR